MTEYRITKYNPSNRIDGTYLADEWTAFSDVGKIFDGVALSYEAYIEKENSYIDCCIELIQKSKVSTLYVEQVECYTEGLVLPLSVSHTEEISKIIRACLREQCWFKLSGKDFFIHFGYDYYMYVGSVLPIETVEKIALKHSLYCEQFPSPYNDIDEQEKPKLK